MGGTPGCLSSGVSLRLSTGGGWEEEGGSPDGTDTLFSGSGGFPPLVLKYFLSGGMGGGGKEGGPESFGGSGGCVGPTLSIPVCSFRGMGTSSRANREPPSSRCALFGAPEESDEDSSSGVGEMEGERPPASAPRWWRSGWPFTGGWCSLAGRVLNALASSGEEEGCLEPERFRGTGTGGCLCLGLGVGLFRGFPGAFVGDMVMVGAAAAVTSAAAGVGPLVVEEAAAARRG